MRSQPQLRNDQYIMIQTLSLGYVYVKAMEYDTIDLFTARQKVVHNGGSPNFKGSLFDKKTTSMAQILQSLSYKVCFNILPKFNSFGLFILILGTPAIKDQTACF